MALISEPAYERMVETFSAINEHVDEAILKNCGVIKKLPQSVQRFTQGSQSLVNSFVNFAFFSSRTLR